MPPVRALTPEAAHPRSPPEYSDVCFATHYRCDYPTAEVHIVVRSELLRSAPDAIEFLKKWDFHAGNQLTAEDYLNASGADYSEVAVWFLRNTTEWQSWVTPEAREKVFDGLSDLPNPPTPAPTPTPIPSQDFGPLSGELEHLDSASNKRPIKAAGVSVQNFVAEATFANPYDCSARSWAHGLLFRVNENVVSNPLVAIGVSCNGYWSVDVGSGDSQERRYEGQTTGLSTGSGELNHLRVVAVDHKGWFFLNGALVSVLDLTGAVHTGDVVITTGHYIGSQSIGFTTPYLQFRASELLWLYGPASGQLTPSPDEKAFHHASQSSRDVIVEVTCITPQTDYDCGIYFRDNYPDADEVVGIDNYGSWFHLTKYPNNDDYTEVASGRTRVSSRNVLALIALADIGWFFVNGELVASLNLANNQVDGWIGLFAGFYQGNDAEVEFTDFNVWAPANGEH
ncbi:MAG: hypothetical protein OXT51_07395 [Chloroflexota bacterium]|nr:hypothetical protein [Chloroflexota bacterium]